MTDESFAKLIITCCITLSAVTFTAAQNRVQDRSITSDDFASQRPAAKAQNPRQRRNQSRASRPTRATYKLVKKPTSVRWNAKGKVPSQPAAPPSSTKISEIGVTIWKLRPAVRADVGFKLPVKVSGAIQLWTAERVSTDSPFRAGDRIRLAVESPTSGFLYVINSEIGSDGSLGEPHLIFPENATQDNSVVPGMLVDIPDQREELPYFVMNPKKENYAGEGIAIVISPIQLRFRTDSKGKIESVDDLNEIMMSVEAEVFVRTDQRDRIFTTAESQSTCGAKTRQLTREKVGVQPCGAASRQLTREEPLPQTIYRVKTAPGKPAVAVIELRTLN